MKKALINIIQDVFFCVSAVFNLQDEREELKKKTNLLLILKNGLKSQVKNVWLNKTVCIFYEFKNYKILIPYSFNKKVFKVFKVKICLH